MSSYYDQTYYAWQKKAGLYGAVQDIWMYKPYIKPTDIVLDFGCGGGYMLHELQCAKKIGVDINKAARNEAKRNGLIVFAGMSMIPTALKFSTIISHHALEHVETPYEILNQIYRRLKIGGTFVCVVPIDDWRKEKKYIETDINKHLYTWTPLLIGNLFTRAGFTIKDIQIITFAWLPLSRFYYRFIPAFIYKALGYFWSAWTNNRQIRIVAIRQ